MTILKISSLLFVLLFSGCSLIPLPKLATPKKPETVYNWTERMVTTPKAVVCNGKVIVVEGSEKTLQVGLAQTPQKMSFSEKVGSWISRLSFIGVLALFGGLIIAPGATLGWLVKTLFKWKTAFKETVLAIKEAKTVDENSALKNSLSSKQSVATKKLVDDIKRSV